MAGKTTQKTLILRRLAEAGSPLAVHELGLIGVSENGAATRLSELQASGLVVGEYAENKAYKHWRLRRKDEPFTGNGTTAEKHRDSRSIKVVGSRPGLVEGFWILTVRSDEKILEGANLKISRREKIS